MKTICICVYRDTIEQHDESRNLTEVLVTEDFVKQYVEERKSGVFDNMEDFLNNYTADDTEDFYEYAVKHGAVIKTENW